MTIVALPEQTASPRVLIVDDDPAIGRVLRMYLTKEGYDVDLAETGREGLEKAQSGGYDLLILDVMLPEKDGWQVCRQLREEGSRIPILMLSARADELDRVLGLDLGADDYVVKPFSPKELAARMRAVLRRVDSGDGKLGEFASERTVMLEHGAAQNSDPSPIKAENDRVSAFQADTDQEQIEFAQGSIIIDPARRSLRVKGKDIELTAREFDLLYYLARRAGVVFRREQLLDEVWGYDYVGGSRTVDEHVRKLRRKLQSAGIGKMIRTVRGVGYACTDDLR